MASLMIRANRSRFIRVAAIGSLSSTRATTCIHSTCIGIISRSPKFMGKKRPEFSKTTVLTKGFSRVDVDFVADNPGLTLFHCHQNLHMDFGFMRLFEYV